MKIDSHQEGKQFGLFVSEKLLAFPDEILFSFCSRYHILSGEPFASVTCLRLFGAQRVGYQHDLPSGLDKFVECTNGEIGDVNSIIGTRTIAPFFLPFLAEASRVALLEGMRGSMARNLKLTLGVPGARFRAHHPLKACRACMVDDRAKYGVPIWHRAHQLPGVWLCVTHDEVLAEADAKVNGIRPYEWILPHQCALRVRSLSKHAIDAARRLAILVSDLIEMPIGFSLERTRLLDTFRAAFSESDSMTQGGVLRLAKIAPRFASICDPLRLLPDMSHLPGGLEQAKARIGRLFQLNRGNPHPLQWLALVLMEFQDWADFSQAYAKSDEMLSGHTPPASRAAQQSLHSCSNESRDPRFNDLMRAINKGASLPDAARAIGVDRRLARAWCQRFDKGLDLLLSNVSQTKRDRIVALIAGGHSKKQVARKAKIDVSLVRYVAIKNRSAELAHRHARQERYRRRSRRSLLATIAANPTLSRAHLRSKCVAAYSWLLTNDREWLESQLPAKVTGTARRPRTVDWRQRDLELSATIAKARPQVSRLSRGSTITALKRAVPDLSLRLRYLPRLPRTQRALKPFRRVRRRDTAPMNRPIS